MCVQFKRFSRNRFRRKRTDCIQKQEIEFTLNDKEAPIHPNSQLTPFFSSTLKKTDLICCSHSFFLSFSRQVSFDGSQCEKNLLSLFARTKKLMEKKALSSFKLPLSLSLSHSLTPTDLYYASIHHTHSQMPPHTHTHTHSQIHTHAFLSIDKISVILTK